MAPRGPLPLPLQPQFLPEGQLPASSQGGRWWPGAGAYGCYLSPPLCCLAHLGEGTEGVCPQPWYSGPLSPSPPPALQGLGAKLRPGGLAGQSEAQLRCISLVTTVAAAPPPPRDLPAPAVTAKHNTRPGKTAVGRGGTALLPGERRRSFHPHPLPPWPRLGRGHPGGSCRARVSCFPGSVILGSFAACLPFQ